MGGVNVFRDFVTKHGFQTLVAPQVGKKRKNRNGLSGTPEPPPVTMLEVRRSSYDLEKNISKWHGEDGSRFTTTEKTAVARAFVRDACYIQRIWRIIYIYIHLYFLKLAVKETSSSHFVVLYFIRPKKSCKRSIQKIQSDFPPGTPTIEPRHWQWRQWHRGRFHGRFLHGTRCQRPHFVVCTVDTNRFVHHIMWWLYHSKWDSDGSVTHGLTP